MSYTAEPAGGLRHRVQIIRHNPNPPQNETGETIEQDAAGQYRWAKIETPTTTTGYEKYRAVEVIEDVSHIVTIRYTPEISTADQLRYRGRTLDIASMIDPDELHIDLILFCKEIVEAKA